ncbi:MAG: hemolysin family protein [Pseudomonadota bacterium]
MFSLVVLFILLLLCSAFFSSSETALFSLSGVWLHRFREARGSSAAKVVAALRMPRKMLVTILLGNEFANVAISIVGAAIVSRLIPTTVGRQTVLAIAIVTPIVLVAGEIVPKNIALRFAPQLAPVLIWPLTFFYRVVRPLRALLAWIANRVIALLGGEPTRAEPMIMEEEFRRLVDIGHKEGAIVEEERELIHNVFEFTDKVVSDIMTPAEKLFALSVDFPYERVIEEIKSVQFSRVPFYAGGPDNIMGVLHVRDLFAFHRRRLSDGNLDLKELLKEPLFVDRGAPLEALLKEFQRTQMHMAIVRDDGKKLEGVVTMDDVLEELFGEME